MTTKARFRTLITPFLICGTLLLTGCATMFAPGSDKVTIKTNPSGAEVYYGANLLGKTPLVHEFKRDTFELMVLTIRKPGYKTEELTLNKVLESKALFNLGFITTTFGVTSWGIDAANGNMVRYSPDSYLIDLERGGNAANEQDQLRLQRLRFVVLSQEYLMIDIAAGGGEYLQAYFASRTADRTSGSYGEFLSHVTSQAPLLLSTDDPVEFYNNLEKIS